MAARADRRALDEFNEHLSELSETWYEGDERQAFRHAAFQIIAPDPTLSDEQVIELTAIDHSGDLEVDGWFVDEQSETVFLFQSAGGEAKVAEDKVSKFWQAPEELLSGQRVTNSTNQSVRELSEHMDARIAEDFSISMVFASRGGFAPAARTFAESRRSRERSLTRLSGDNLICRCSFELLDLSDVAKAFDDYRAGFRTERTDVELQVNDRWTYVVDQSGPRSIRATIPAREIVRVFYNNGYSCLTSIPADQLRTPKSTRISAKPSTRRRVGAISIS